jgi:hypothetical protein
MNVPMAQPDGEQQETQADEVTAEFEVTEVGSRRAIEAYFDTLPPPPAEDTIPG